MTNPYSFPRYYVQKNIFGLFNQWFRVFDENGSIVFFCKMRAFKLKEDFRILAADKTTELIRIKARNVIDFGATYDVLDVSTEQLLGSFRRKGLKSIFRDEWVIFDVNEQEVGVVREDSGGMAFLRRMLGGLPIFFRLSSTLVALVTSRFLRFAKLEIRS